MRVTRTNSVDDDEIMISNDKLLKSARNVAKNVSLSSKKLQKVKGICDIVT